MSNAKETNAIEAILFGEYEVASKNARYLPESIEGPHAAEYELRLAEFDVWAEKNGFEL